MAICHYRVKISILSFLEVKRNYEASVRSERSKLFDQGGKS